MYAKAVLKFAKLNTVAQQREAVTRGRSRLPYRLRYIFRDAHGLSFSQKMGNNQKNCTGIVFRKLS
ncbi:MAG: hypothetical protein LBL62_11415 [Planctomycetaceae bacterium]|nr:hypothetical protein [Planctomycetaceae bacterium]